MNQIILIGRITADPELRTTQSGINMVNFTVAVQRKYKNDQGRYDADFIRCVAWRQTADFLHQYATKGRKIALTGELQSRTYDKDGQKRTLFEVVANSVELIDKRDVESRDDRPADTQPGSHSGFTEVTDDELPFERRVSLPDSKRR